jgi:hypothetical protein
LLLALGNPFPFSIAEEARSEVVENWFERVLIAKVTVEVSLFITRLSKGIRFRIFKSPKQQSKLKKTV